MYSLRLYYLLCRDDMLRVDASSYGGNRSLMAIRSKSMGIGSRCHWSPRQVGLESQAGGTGVPSRWYWSTEQVVLES